MMFVISKIVGFAIDPLNLTLVSGLVLGLSAQNRLAWLRLLRPFAFTFLLFIASMFVLPWGGWLVASLENRANPSDCATVTKDAVCARAEGMIVLGGAANGRASRARQSLELSEHGDRLMPLITALRHGDKPVIYTGAYETTYSIALLSQFLTADELSRLVIEPAALTTAEHPWRIAEAGIRLDNPEQVYVLVTSAFHMPRATAVFRKAGIGVHPHSTDYLAAGRTKVRWNPSLRQQLDLLRIGIKEYIGLAGYKLAGKI